MVGHNLSHERFPDHQHRVLVFLLLLGSSPKGGNNFWAIIIIIKFLPEGGSRFELSLLVLLLLSSSPKGKQILSYY